MIDPYVYPGIIILKNILGIQNRKMLDATEADYVFLRLRELAGNPLKRNCDIDHLSKMHSKKEYLEMIIRDSLESAKTSGRNK